MTRTHARAPIGQRAVVSEPFNPGAKLSVISALKVDGVCAPMMIEGAFNSEVFDLYVAQMLLPCLRAGTIMVFDNIKFHYSPRAIALIEAAGAKVLYLPAYSPDFNPLEECISKIKAALRSFKARTPRKLFNALAKGGAKKHGHRLAALEWRKQHRGSVSAVGRATLGRACSAWY